MASAVIGYELPKSAGNNRDTDLNSYCSSLHKIKPIGSRVSVLKTNIWLSSTLRSIITCTQLFDQFNYLYFKFTKILLP
jgi:hypothetical protein